MRIKDLFFVALCGLIFLGSCNDDDDVGPGEFQVNFKDQDLQGEINDSSFFYTGGLVDTDSAPSGFTHKFQIIDTLVDSTTCQPVNDTIRKIIFSYTDGNGLVKPGRTDLFFAPGAPASSIITIKFSYYDADTVVQQIVVSQGAYEILTVDTAMGIVTGRMHVKENNKNKVNGNFTLRYCDF